MATYSEMPNFILNKDDSLKVYTPSYRIKNHKAGQPNSGIKIWYLY
jgi:hypothetical protein